MYIPILFDILARSKPYVIFLTTDWNHPSYIVYYEFSPRDFMYVKIYSMFVFTP